LNIKLGWNYQLAEDRLLGHFQGVEQVELGFIVKYSVTPA